MDSLLIDGFLSVLFGQTYEVILTIILAPILGVIFKRFANLVANIRDVYLEQGRSLRKRISQLENYIEDIEGTALKAYGKASIVLDQADGGLALPEPSPGEQLVDRTNIQEELIEHMKDFHKNLANTLSLPATRISEAEVSGLRNELESIRRKIIRLRKSSSERPFYSYKDQVIELINVLVKARKKTNRHYDSWGEITNSFVALYHAVVGELDSKEERKIRSFSIRTQTAIQTWQMPYAHRFFSFRMFATRI